MEQTAFRKKRVINRFTDNGQAKKGFGGCQTMSVCKSCHEGLCMDMAPLTNADRIRAMTDEELAEWIVRKTEGNGFDGYEAMVKAWLDWLKQVGQTDMTAQTKTCNAQRQRSCRKIAQEPEVKVYASELCDDCIHSKYLLGPFDSVCKDCLACYKENGTYINYMRAKNDARIKDTSEVVQ